MTTLFDSNVLIAATIAEHLDRDASLAALQVEGRAVAIHSLSEVYNTLTKPKPYGRDPRLVATVVERFATAMTVVGLTHDQHVGAIQRFATLGGIGARLYDYLIGEAARLTDRRTVVTLNAGHFIPLFPDLRILTPAQYLETF